MSMESAPNPVRWQRIVAAIFRPYFRIAPLPHSFFELKTALQPTIVVTESASPLIAALLASFARRAGLRGASHITQAREIPWPASDSHDVSRTLYWCTVHEVDLLQALTRQNPHLAVRTLNIFSRRGPLRYRPSYHLSWWDLLGIIVFCRFLVILLGPAFSLGGFNATQIRRLLRLDLYRNLKLVRGIPFQAIEQQARLVMHGPEFDREISQIAGKLGISPDSARRRARAAFFEIAANPRPAMYRIVAFAARILVARLFRSVTTHGLKELTETLKDHTVVIVPMHRSHLDYVLIGHTLYEEKLNPPLVAAGINLSFWPLGYFIRSVGAYFVKRNVRQDRLHALLLKRYVTYLARRGHLQEFFIEGGRSRTGKMRHPRLGLLNVFVDCYKRGMRRDILFVPTSITYEKVIEDSAFGDENSGQAKVKESFWSLLRARKIFERQYGDVVIQFGKPVSLAAEAEIIQSDGNGRATPLTSRLALKISQRIRDQSNPSLTSICTTALLNAPSYGMTRGDLSRAVRELAGFIGDLRRLYGDVGVDTPTLNRFVAGRHALLDDLAHSGFIEERQLLTDSVFYIPGKRRFTADFYRNTTAHLFVPLGVLAIEDLAEDYPPQEIEQMLWLLIQRDMLLPERERFAALIADVRKILIARGVVAADRPRTVFINRESALFMPAFLLPAIESMLWVLDRLRLERRARLDGEPGLDYDAFVTQAQDEFLAARYLGRVMRTESSSQAALLAALETLAEWGTVAVVEKGAGRKTLLVREVDGQYYLQLLRMRSVIVSQLVRSMTARFDPTVNVSAPIAAPPAGKL